MRAVHSDIDETIAQIDYITNMHSEEVFDELKQIVRNLAAKKSFLDDLQIAVGDEAFDGYLELFNYPHELRAALAAKAEILGREQIRISLKIKDHVEKTKGVIRKFALRFEKFANVGLQTKTELMRNQNKENE